MSDEKPRAESRKIAILIPVVILSKAKDLLSLALSKKQAPRFPQGDK
jgi:hypothetical protein